MAEPSSAARAAKFEQDQLKEKQINALLLNRREIEGLLAGNEADLKHVGYHFPETAAPEKKFTLEEAFDYIRVNGDEIVRATSWKNLHLSHAALTEEIKRLNALLEKRKAVKKKSAKKK